MAPTADSLPKAYTAQGAGLRVCILRARWNDAIIQALVKGCRDRLLAAGVKEEDIVEETVPGSYELPFAAKAIINGSNTLSPTTLLGGATDLLTSGSSTSLSSLINPSTPSASPKPTKPYDVLIAIGVLVKGSTMHFEYIAESVSHGLMNVQIETGTPVVFGVLTCLTDEQAFQRAGISTENVDKNHNHGDDWGNAAVELAFKSSQWKTGRVVGV
ncbi:6,7-dimethyl-8-ribityllumazine synthase [Phaffia rhodozyma]|uniref:6,7-dimethyl-8-ribityllumazine synthase n=1 Tax=Phaffia rhodozyma TaxID=264483 RepID=A0A0F7SP06_PHARH|nr:6,7-dimethyl-8-ribityllumazine synthase [Phaffia rhodozyma]